MNTWMIGHLNMENITDGDYTHAGRVCKDFKITNLDEYHYLYVRSDKFLVSIVFKNFQNSLSRSNGK